MKNDLKMQEDMTALMGGEKVSVTYHNGKTETVFVRELPVRLFQDYALVVADESKSVELFCSKPEGWADTLTRKSFLNILAKGEETNLSFFVEWGKRLHERTAKIIPQRAQEIQKEQVAMAGPHSPASALTPQPS